VRFVLVVVPVPSVQVQPLRLPASKPLLAARFAAAALPLITNTRPAQASNADSSAIAARLVLDMVHLHTSCGGHAVSPHKMD
jgi:hypothetical protein